MSFPAAEWADRQQRIRDARMKRLREFIGKLDEQNDAVVVRVEVEAPGQPYSLMEEARQTTEFLPAVPERPREPDPTFVAALQGKLDR